MKALASDEVAEVGGRMGLAVWRCQDQYLFHMRVGDILLTFTPT